MAAIPLAVMALLVAAHTVVWAVVDMDTVVHLPGKYRALAEVVDTPDRRVDKAGMFAGTAEVEVDLP